MKKAFINISGQDLVDLIARHLRFVDEGKFGNVNYTTTVLTGSRFDFLLAECNVEHGSVRILVSGDSLPDDNGYGTRRLAITPEMIGLNEVDDKTDMMVALHECITQGGSHAMDGGEPEMRRRLLAINEIARKAIQKTRRE